MFQKKKKKKIKLQVQFLIALSRDVVKRRPRKFEVQKVTWQSSLFKDVLKMQSETENSKLDLLLAHSDT